MEGLKARVTSRLVLDVPTNLPEGTVLDLVVDDGGDDLTDEDRAALHKALAASMEEFERGESVPAEEVLAELRRRR